MVKAAIFDFDGTISTIRHGWEQVMGPMMLEFLDPGRTGSPELVSLVERYIDESTGIQTIYQMQWLREQVRERNPGQEAPDSWWYKDEYNRRLMAFIKSRLDNIADMKALPKDFMIAGSEEFLGMLRGRGVTLYIASGTDDEDVRREAGILGLTRYFDRIQGAPHRRADCSKEAVIRSLIQDDGVSGRELAVIGDGRVEIGIGREVGAKTLGIASDEEKRRGVNPRKEKKLQAAGADRITGDFTNAGELIDWLMAE